MFAKLKSNSVVQAEPSELHFSGFEVGKDYKKILVGFFTCSSLSCSKKIFGCKMNYGMFCGMFKYCFGGFDYAFRSSATKDSLEILKTIV